MVRFWGHDSAIESSFVITSHALQSIEPGIANDEDGMLAAFDRHRIQICAAAARVYQREGKNFYELDVRHF